MADDFAFHTNHVVPGLRTEPLKHRCEKCGSTDHWHWHYGVRKNDNEKYKELCDDCYRGTPHKPAGSALSYEQRLEHSLKPGEMLGPRIKGADGMRGIFQVHKRK